MVRDEEEFRVQRPKVARIHGLGGIESEYQGRRVIRAAGRAREICEKVLKALHGDVRSIVVTCSDLHDVGNFVLVF